MYQATEQWYSRELITINNFIVNQQTNSINSLMIFLEQAEFICLAIFVIVFIHYQSTLHRTVTCVFFCFQFLETFWERKKEVWVIMIRPISFAFHFQTRNLRRCFVFSTYNWSCSTVRPVVSGKTETTLEISRLEVESETYPGEPEHSWISEVLRCSQSFKRWTIFMFGRSRKIVGWNKNLQIFVWYSINWHF